MNKYAQANGNWNDAIWYDAASGGNPVSTPGVGDTANLNGLNIALNVNPTCDGIQTSGAGGTLVIPAAGTPTINALVKNQTAVDPMVAINAANKSLTINGQTQNTSTGRLFTISAGGSLAINNGTADAILSSGAGSNPVVNTSGVSNGSITITGNVKSTGSALALLINDGSFTITGNILSTGSTYGAYLYGDSGTLNGNIAPNGGYGVLGNGTGAWTLNGNITCTGGKWGLCSNYTNITWVGARTLAAGEECILLLQNGSLIFATASDQLTLSNSGRLALVKQGGSLIGSNGGHIAQIIHQSAVAQASFTGGSTPTVVRFRGLQRIGKRGGKL